METLQKIARSLRTARASDLPGDNDLAFHMLMPMVMQNQHRAVSELISSSPYDVSHQAGRAKRSLLHVAANVGAYDCLVYLLRKGADVNCQDIGGVTPLQLAARNGHTKCIQKLLECKANIHIHNNEGMTAVHWLASNGRTELLGELLKHVDVDIEDSQGQTALHNACLSGHTSSVLLLLERKADMSKSDHKGCTPLFYACRHGHLDCVRLLLSRGAQLLRANDQETPLDIAVKNGYESVCAIILEYYPSLLNSLLLLVKDTRVEESKGLSGFVVSYTTLHLKDRIHPPSLIYKVLRYLCQSNYSIQNKIMSNLGEHAATAGLELLSLSSDYDAAVSSFLRIIRLACKLYGSPRLLGNTRPRVYTSGPTVYARADSTSSRIRAAFSGRLSSSTSSCSDDQESPQANVFAPLEKVWEALEEWFLLLLNEMEDIEGNAGINDCALLDNGIHPGKDVQVKSPVTRHLSETLYTTQRHSLFSKQDDLPDTEQKCSLSRSVSATGRLGGDLSRNVAAALVPYRVQSIRQKLLRMGSDATFRLSQPAIEMNLDRFGDGSISPGCSSPDDSNVFGFPALPRRSVSSPNSQPVLEREAHAGRDSHVVRDNHARRDIHAGQENRVEGENGQCDPRVENRTVSPAFSPVDSDVITRTADRLCVITHGFYLCCCNQSRWDRRNGAPPRFVDFVSRHEDVLQALVARNPKILFSHFHFLLDSPVLMQKFFHVVLAQPFEERQKWFYENLFKQNNQDGQGSNYTVDEKNVIEIKRGDDLFNISCEVLSKISTEVLKRNVVVRFQGEPGVGRGVLKEWLDLLSKEILNPDFALFTQSVDGTTFQPCSNSEINPDHLNYFRFAGRIIGLSLYNRLHLNVYFTRSFYKHILGIPVSYQDVSSIDPEYAKNLQWILDNDISDLGFDLTFAVETDVFGTMREIDLKSGGSELMVTEENKHEYVQLVADLKLTRAIRPQICSFLDGFHEFIPHSLVSLFDEYELELLMSGLPEVNMDDWEKNTTYVNGYDVESPVVMWFWKVLRALPKTDVVLLLQFATGSSRVPLGGFSNLSGTSGPHQFCISRVEFKPNLLPSASTCFNMLRLPEYRTEEELKDRLLVALRCGSQGFDFA